MPYISRAAQERARWLTLTQTTAFVARADRCTPKSAERQLRAALSDRRIFIKWEDQRPTPGASPGGEMMIAIDKPPRDGEGWRDERDGWRHWAWEEADIRGDQVFDPFTRRYRVLLLSRFGIEQIWAERSPAPRTATRRHKVKELLLARNVDLSLSEKEIFKYVRTHWSDGTPPSERTIDRAITDAKAAKTQE